MFCKREYLIQASAYHQGFFCEIYQISPQFKALVLASIILRWDPYRFRFPFCTVKITIRICGSNSQIEHHVKHFLNRCKPQHSHQSTFIIKSARFTDSIQTGTDIHTILEKERNCDCLQYAA